MNKLTTAQRQALKAARDHGTAWCKADGTLHAATSAKQRMLNGLAESGLLDWQRKITPAGLEAIK